MQVIYSTVSFRVYFTHRLAAFPVVKRPKIQRYSQFFVMSCMVARKCLWFKISSFKKIKQKLKTKCC